MSIDTLGYSSPATKSDLSVLKSEFFVAMADLRTDLTRYIVSVAALIIGVIALADGLLFFALKH